ncbi:hypothetical protein HHI36_023370 [Cryptolaemus montrouzieri]|uniref:Endonuclease/exonuclease/phosphatase domain-containing protein n=1 Tax=Cryptolaemus montrouzieri TaxID=559131 RepID=A0ABD2PGZ6_9CUCU
MGAEQNRVPQGWHETITLVLAQMYKPSDSTIEAKQDMLIMCSNISSLADNNKNVLIHGYFNFPTISWLQETNLNTKTDHTFLEMQLALNLTQLNEKPTHYRNNDTPNNFDPLLTNESELLSDIELLPPKAQCYHLIDEELSGIDYEGGFLDAMWFTRTESSIQNRNTLTRKNKLKRSL